MAKLNPYIKIKLGEFIKEEMEIRNWSKKDLAKVIKLPLKTIDEILSNRQKITIDLAKKISIVFGLSAKYWLKVGKY